jgi:hypothetical protein
MKKLIQKIGAGLALATVAVANFPSTVLATNPAPTSGKSLADLLKPGEMGNVSFTEIVPILINAVFILGFALTFFYLIFGAISWITSGGDKSKVEAARGKITAAVIGLLILAASWAVFTLLIQLVVGKDLTEINLPKLTT